MCRRRCATGRPYGGVAPPRRVRCKGGCRDPTWEIRIHCIQNRVKYTCISLYSKSCHCICRPLGELHAEGEHLALAEVVALCKVSLVFGGITIGVALPPFCSTFVVHDPGSGCRQEACLEPSTTLPSKVQRQAIGGAPYYTPPLVFALYLDCIQNSDRYNCICVYAKPCLSVFPM